MAAGILVVCLGVTVTACGCCPGRAYSGHGWTHGFVSSASSMKRSESARLSGLKGASRRPDPRPCQSVRRSANQRRAMAFQLAAQSAPGQSALFSSKQSGSPYQLVTKSIVAPVNAAIAPTMMKAQKIAVRRREWSLLSAIFSLVSKGVSVLGLHLLYGF